MALSPSAAQYLEVAIADPHYAKEIIAAINGSVQKGAAVASVSVTATTGSLPTPNGATVIANTATPTVVELLDLCMELKAKLDILSARAS